jgi:hypothetical protein
MKIKEMIRLMEDILICILLDENKRGDVLIFIFKILMEGIPIFIFLDEEGIQRLTGLNKLLNVRKSHAC